MAEVQAEWSHYVPHLPAQSACNRRVRWLWGAFESLRQALLRASPQDPWQHVETTALPLKHPSRVRSADRWDGPDALHAGFGGDGAHAEWFDGFRLALQTDRDPRLVRAWGIVPAAVNEREVVDALPHGTPTRGVLVDRGFPGRTWQAQPQAQGRHVVLTPAQRERQHLSIPVRWAIARLRNRIETTNGAVTEHLGLAHHRAKTFWGLLTRTAATILAHTLRLLNLV